MPWFYENLIRPALFCRDSEQIHNDTLSILGCGSRLASCRALARSLFMPPPLPFQLFGLNFPNPLGLAAGMDKHGKALPIWESLGFGFAEIGGVTWHPQPGNPQPRMFRAPQDQALINRMGFNNPGAEGLARQLSFWKSQNLWPAAPVGINLGKSKITPLEKAAEDYSQSFNALKDLADFFVVNVSSPNTPNLRALQDKKALREILLSIQSINRRMPEQKPVLVKVAPDLTFEALDELLELAPECNLSGIVATNTTIDRPVAMSPRLQKIYAETGGLSGRPLAQKSTRIIRHIYRQTGGKLPIIGVGGIFDADDAWKKMVAGASLLQIYTALVFRGPGVVSEIVDGIRARLKLHGLSSPGELTFEIRSEIAGAKSDPLN